MFEFPQILIVAAALVGFFFLGRAVYRRITDANGANGTGGNRRGPRGDDL